MAARTATIGVDGRLIVRKKVTDQKKRRILKLVGDGMAPAAAARQVKVSPAEMQYELRHDTDFEREMGYARDGLAAALEESLIEQATVGVTRDFYDRKTGELIRREHIPNPRLMQAAIEAHDPRYKREGPQTNVLVVTPLSTEEFRSLQAAGRADEAGIEQLAAEMAQAEHARDQLQIEAGK
jgi:hypothetical protein